MLIINKTGVAPQVSAARVSLDLQNGGTRPAWSVQIQGTFFTVFVRQLELLCPDLEVM
jgi:hypothetical protein